MNKGKTNLGTKKLLLMNNKILAILLISLLFNLLFLLLGTLFISRRGGFLYLFKKIFIKDSTIIEYDPYYLHRKTQFEILPKSNSAIIFLGDSLTNEGEWAEILENSNINNRGISADTTDLVLKRLDAIIELHPKKIFLMIGINDLITERKSVEQTLAGHKKILSEFQKKIPATQVFIQSVLPVNNQITRYWQDNQNAIELNSKLQELAKEFSYQYIDVFSYLADSENQLDANYTSDGLHLNGQGYLKWKKAVEKYVNDQEL
ncbi:GDSL-type esterase/lipase family protein [Scytonema sp. NUACC21]